MGNTGDVDYSVYGEKYAFRRRTDPSIAARLHAALGDARTVVNVGAGAGSYEPADRHVIAVEPSDAMRAQRPSTVVPAIRGAAEKLPLDDNAVDAAMATVTVHQWSNLAAGLAELRRVSRGPIAILTFDRDRIGDYWLAEYAPELIAAEFRRYPPLDRIAELLGGDTEIQPVPIPLDCPDGFTEAFYGRPEQLTREEVRRSQSAWSFVANPAARRAVDALTADLADGVWDRRIGHLRHQPTFDGSLRLLISRP